MVFIAIVAVNLATIRVGLIHRSAIVDLLELGGLPMLNVLIVVFLIDFLSRRKRPFILGFELIGATALALYVAGVIHYQQRLAVYYLGPFLSRYVLTFGPVLTTVHQVVVYLIAVAMLLIPQVALAAIGGFLLRNIWQRSRRNRSTSPPSEILNSVMPVL
jgi:hypothetical protein